jgi:hypothetical protein
MDIFSYQTRDHTKVEICHSIVNSSESEIVQVGDHVLSIHTPNGGWTLALTESQWLRLLDMLSGV